MENDKQKKLNLFKWRMNKEELKNQVENYNTLSFFKSARKTAAALVFFSIILIIFFSIINGNFFQNYIDILVLIVLTFFVYKGNELAIVAIMVLSTVMGGALVLDSLESLNLGPFIIGCSAWWIAVMGMLLQAYQVEEYKKEYQEDKTKVIGWYNKFSDYFFCSKCFINIKDIEKEKYEPVRIESLKNDIYTCNKCGEIFNGISKKDKIKKTIAMIFSILASIIIIFYGFSMFYLSGFSSIFFWLAILFLTLGVLNFLNCIKLEKNNIFESSKNLIYTGIFFIIFPLYDFISNYFEREMEFFFIICNPFFIIGFLIISAGFLGINTDKIKKREFYLEKRKKFFKKLKVLSILILLFLIGFTIFVYIFDNIDKSKEEINIFQANKNDWQTYNSEEHGFEFKYPKDWGKIIPDQADTDEGIGIDWKRSIFEAQMKIGIYTFFSENKNIKKIWYQPSSGSLAFVEYTGHEGPAIDGGKTMLKQEALKIIRFKDKPIQIYTVPENKVSWYVKIHSVRFSPDGNYICFGMAGWEWGKPMIVDVQTKKNILEDVNTGFGVRGIYQDIFWSQNSKNLIISNHFNGFSGEGREEILISDYEKPEKLNQVFAFDEGFDLLESGIYNVRLTDNEKLYFSVKFVPVEEDDYEKEYECLVKTRELKEIK